MILVKSKFGGWPFPAAPNRCCCPLVSALLCLRVRVVCHLHVGALLSVCSRCHEHLFRVTVFTTCHSPLHRIVSTCETEGFMRYRGSARSEFTIELTLVLLFFVGTKQPQSDSLRGGQSLSCQHFMFKMRTVELIYASIFKYPISFRSCAARRRQCQQEPTYATLPTFFSGLIVTPFANLS